ncbi:hypothetical protein D082_33330 [Synechocystis sp. PCC 6714]|nr:hypothetical protein D082_33330 [Synechocystis sp. PCC 6714]
MFWWYTKQIQSFLSPIVCSCAMALGESFCIYYFYIISIRLPWR